MKYEGRPESQDTSPHPMVTGNVFSNIGTTETCATFLIQSVK